MLSLLIRHPKGLAGIDILRNSDLKSGTLYPLLHRLECEGWLTSLLENGNPHALRRPLRRTYKLTATGRKRVRRIVESLQLKS